MSVLLQLSDEDEAITPTDLATGPILLAQYAAQSLHARHRFLHTMIQPETEQVVLSPDPLDDEDDDGLVGDEDDDQSEDDLLDSDKLQTLDDMALDPDLAHHMLNNMQTRFKNFEDILVDLRCQLNEMHQRDDDLLKRMTLVNEEIAELSLLDNYDTSSRSATTAGGAPGDNYPDNYSDYGADPLTTPTTTTAHTERKGSFPK